MIILEAIALSYSIFLCFSLTFNSSFSPAKLDLLI
jgi:hypothetical protein